MTRLYTRMVRWLILPVVLAAVLVVVLTSGGGTPTVSSGAIAQAADVTTRVAGADLHVSISVTVPVLGRSLSMIGDGYESFTSRNGVLNLHLNGLPSALSSAGATFQIRFLYPRLFVRSGLLSTVLPSGKSWVGVNLAQSLHQQGISSAVLSSAGSDPAQFLEYLKAVSGGVQKLGSERIGGVATTHYHAVLDLRRYAALVPAGQRASARQAIARLAKTTGASQIPTDVWVDSHHLVRQVRLNLSLHPAARPGTGLSEVVTVDLSRFGTKPPVSAPPAAQTYDATGLAGLTR